MKNHPQFDFLADKEKNTITVLREFMTGRQLPPPPGMTLFKGSYSDYRL